MHNKTKTGIIKFMLSFICWQENVSLHRSWIETLNVTHLYEYSQFAFTEQCNLSCFVIFIPWLAYCGYYAVMLEKQLCIYSRAASRTIYCVSIDVLLRAVTTIDKNGKLYFIGENWRPILQ